jgi:hypothetical protein
MENLLLKTPHRFKKSYGLPPFLAPGGHFWQSYEENQVHKNFCKDLPYDFEKSEIDICTRIFDFAKRTVP